MKLNIPTMIIFVTILLFVLGAGCTDSSPEETGITENKSPEGNSEELNAPHEGFRTVVDSRGVEVEVPVEISRVVTISDGMIEGVMTVFGVQDKIVGLGSSCIQRNFNYTYGTVSGDNFTYENGMNPVTCLNPRLIDLPLVVKSGSAINYETLAGLEPDLVILRLGSCSLRYAEDESTAKTISTIKALGIPLIVLYGPNACPEAGINSISKEIRILGEVFGQENKAAELSGYLEEQVQLVNDRTKDISEEEKPSVLVFGLSPRARKTGGAGQVFGLDTAESEFIEEYVHAHNAFQEPGYFKTISTEQVLALEPDVIVLCTASGYHPPKELYEAPYYQNLQEMKAIQTRKVAAFPWSPCNCAKRLEYPIDVMVIAKTAYPERFEDVDLAEWLLDFYQNVYGIDLETAKELRSAQWMDWTLEQTEEGN